MRKSLLALTLMALVLFNLPSLSVNSSQSGTITTLENGFNT